MRLQHPLISQSCALVAHHIRFSKKGVPLPHVYKIKHIAINICERMDHSKALTEFK